MEQQKITPFLWYDGQAEEAANFYVSVFKNAKILRLSHYGEGAPAPAGTVSSVEFQLNGQNFIALNGGPQFKFTPAISMFISCNSQEEIDYYWEKLLQDGGRMDMCGWLQDKYGLSWQVVPSNLFDLLHRSDSEKSQRVMNAMLKMRKLDMDALQNA